jgi:hypothetical protein
MKTLISALVLTAVVTSSVFAAPMKSIDAVTVAGKTIGQDPDQNVRSRLLWDSNVADQ